MAGKVKKIILRALAGIIIFVLLVFVAAYMFLNFYVIPKYNESLGADASQSERITQKDVWDIVKQLADRQVIENIVNFDKDSAKDLLQAAKEIEKDIATEQETDPAQAIVTPEPAKKDAGKNAWSKKVIARAEAIPTPTPTPTPAPKATAVPKKSQVKGATAYERIMNTATKEEISAGSAILAKVNMSKVNQLRSQGKMKELKKYIKSVLTSAEIRRALQLYGKYKHLL